MTNSFQEHPRWVVLPLQLSTGPSKLFEFPKIVSRLPSRGGTCVLLRMHRQHLMQRHFPGVQRVSNLSSRGCIKLLVRVVGVIRGVMSTDHCTFCCRNCCFNLVMLPINCDRNTRTQHTHTHSTNTLNNHTRDRDRGQRHRDAHGNHTNTKAHLKQTRAQYIHFNGMPVRLKFDYLHIIIYLTLSQKTCLHLCDGISSNIYMYIYRHYALEYIYVYIYRHYALG